MNKKHFRRFSTIIVSIALLFALSLSVSAVAIVPEEITYETNSEVTPRAEELEWIYRINNGYYEKRLWSYTYGVWRTDWIVLGPAPTT